jgi:hypothetical protein
MQSISLHHRKSIRLKEYDLPCEIQLCELEMHKRIISQGEFFSGGIFRNDVRKE